MKKHLQSLLTLIVLAGICGPLPAAADRFDRTKAHLEMLLQNRLKVEPLPAKPANPFAFTLPGASLVVNPVGVQPTGPVNAFADDDQILAYCAARLRIGGLVTRGVRVLLLINSSTYQESDLIPVRGTGDTVYYVKILRVTNDVVTFGYNDAVLTLPIRT